MTAITVERVITWIGLLSAAIYGAYQYYGRFQAKRGRIRKDRRRAADEEGDAIIADLRDQLGYLKAEIRSIRAERDADFVTLRAHQVWDRSVYTALSEAGIDVDPPPPLWRAA